MSGKFEKRSKGFKIMTLVLSFVLVVGASVAGTLAWLSAQTDEVVNTFTSAELFADSKTQFTLWENKAEDLDGDGRYTLNVEKVNKNTYDILPGVNIPKNPTVDVVDLEEHAYLYIKVSEDTLTGINGLSYSVDANNWTALDGYAGVYVYSGSNANAVDNIIKATDLVKKTFTANILTQNQDGTAITVSDNYNGSADGIKLSFQAYMVQATGNGNSAAAAWKNTYGATTSDAPANP